VNEKKNEDSKERVISYRGKRKEKKDVEGDACNS